VKPRRWPARIIVGALLFLASVAPCRRAGAAEDVLARVLTAARARGLAQSRTWQVLLHYRRTLFGGWKSEADGLGFFLAGATGKSDPDAELAATLTALFREPPSMSDRVAAQCRFPARTAWLRRELALGDDLLPPRACPTYETWHNTMAAEAVTLVYATAYLNSPASMYGHTFLRLSRATGEGNPLLDYIVNFAADIDTNNGIVYAVKGVTGGFRGYFYVMPYYVKVQEYSNMESRDLWEYQLSLTRDEVERLVAHAWETRSTHFDYYFFTENCSYQLLTLLEVARPELHLIDHFGARVIPSDTVRVVLGQPGLVGRRTPRPAILTAMSRRKQLLSRDEIAAAERWAALPADAPAPAPAPTLAKLPLERQAMIIDAGYDYMRFREGLDKEPSPEFKKRERKLLLARGRLGVPPQTVEATPVIDAPEHGHPTLRVSIGGGDANHTGPFQRLGFRAALHDYLDPPDGYPVDSELEMVDLKLRFDDQPRRFTVDRFDGLNILSALPYDRWLRGLSWKVWAGADNARELGCDRPEQDPHGWRCLYGGVTTGVGVAARFGPGRRALGYALADADAGAGPAFSGHHDFRIGGGAEANVVAEVTSAWRWQLGGRYIYYPLGATGGVLRGTLGESLRLGRSAALRLGVAVAGHYAEASADLCGYF
jgi:hypothetical protein